MHENTFLVRAATRWRVRPTDFPTIRRRCRVCPSMEFRTRGLFRVNANHKLLDIWLLALCAQCGETTKLTVLERANVRTIDPALLSGFHENDPALAARLLTDPLVARRNDIALDWTDAWTLEMDPVELPKADILDVGVHFSHRIPLRVTTLIATGLELSGSEVAKLIAAGGISSGDKLTGRRAGDFGFVVRW
ncbi:DUF1062 domain-containing protein [Catenulispora pinistramenti]|uniref:DUF1062 domain-containing protein n=1 Tax=Catenulispora pinistramenti TaxID=2705254 RepID=UPI0027DB4A5B|nr:DUF1062 domain-containing protein [Catenulispora pinistramenti]